MERKLDIAIVVLSLGVMLFSTCDRSAKRESSNKLQITVSILPQKYFVERVGGKYVDVNVMVKPGANPATYEPNPRQLRILSKADAYMRIRVPFEKAWMDRMKSANSEMLIVDTTKGIKRMSIPARHSDKEHEGEKIHEETKNLDPHIWLSPRLVKVQAQIIYKALIQLDSEHKKTYQANLENFLTDIDTLDAEIRETFAKLENRKFMVFHPSWGYFAHDYGLEMMPVEVGGQEPSAAELASLVTKARKRNVKVIFAQPEFSTRSAESIAQEIDGEVRLIDPLSPDWLDNLREVSVILAKTLEEGK